MLFIEVFKELYRGKSLARALLHLESKKYKLTGKILDVGGGGRRSEYLDYFKNDNNYDWTSIDYKMNSDFNLEIDALPYSDENFDQILNFNLLEHIYNYRFVMKESYRVLKSKGEIIGFVPFLYAYHPDPHDYFRYTKEALFKIFEEVGFKDIRIKEIGSSSFFVNYNNIVFSIPLFLRLVLFPVYFILDYILVRLRPNIKSRYPLGYYFILKK